MYEFKKVQELGWAVLVAAMTTALQVLVASDLVAITDWRAWAVSLGAAVTRAAAGAALAILTRRG